MKCIKCRKVTKGNKIICNSCINTDVANRFATCQKCNSFFQMKGAANGICQNVLLCEVIKKALIGKSLFNDIGHVVCPYSGVNISYITYNDFSEEQLEMLKRNYSECFE